MGLETKVMILGCRLVADSEVYQIARLKILLPRGLQEYFNTSFLFEDKKREPNLPYSLISKGNDTYIFLLRTTDRGNDTTLDAKLYLLGTSMPPLSLFNEEILKASLRGLPTLLKARTLPKSQTPNEHPMRVYNEDGIYKLVRDYSRLLPTPPQDL